MEIDEKNWRRLKGAVNSKNLISRNLINDLNWKAAIFNDNAFDFSAFEGALSNEGIERYFFVPVVDLQSHLKNARIKMVRIGQGEWQQFFDFDDEGFSASLEDCVLFSVPLRYLVLRTGFVEHAIYAGSSEFIYSATGVMPDRGRFIAVGDFWQDSSILEYYRPKSITSDNA